MMMIDFKRDLTWYVRSDVLSVDVTWQDASALSSSEVKAVISQVTMLFLK